MKRFGLVLGILLAIRASGTRAASPSIRDADQRRAYRKSRDGTGGIASDASPTGGPPPIT